MKRLFALFLVLAAGTAHAGAPGQITASYVLTKQGQQIGTVSETFKQEDGRYTLESVTAATGIYALFAKGKIRLISTGEVTEQGLRPLHFEHQRGSDPAKTIRAEFNWEKMSLVHSFDGNTETDKLQPGSQDRISLLYQFLFANSGKNLVKLYMTTGKKLNLYQYKRVGEEKITTPAGQFQAAHYVKQHGADEDGTEIWLARKRGNFPVRIVIEEREGGRIEQNLTALSFDGE